MPEQEQLYVKCYSGHTYAQRPESFVWQNKERKIRRVDSEWLEPGRRCFSVTTEDENVFKLCYNEAQDRWWLLDSSGGENNEADFRSAGKRRPPDA